LINGRKGVAISQNFSCGGPLCKKGKKTRSKRVNPAKNAVAGKEIERPKKKERIRLDVGKKIVSGRKKNPEVASRKEGIGKKKRLVKLFRKSLYGMGTNVKARSRKEMEKPRSRLKTKAGGPVGGVREKTLVMRTREVGGTLKEKPGDRKKSA